MFTARLLDSNDFFLCFGFVSSIQSWLYETLVLLYKQNHVILDQSPVTAGGVAVSPSWQKRRHEPWRRTGRGTTCRTYRERKRSHNYRTSRLSETTKYLQMCCFSLSNITVNRTFGLFVKGNTTSEDVTFRRRNLFHTLNGYLIRGRVAVAAGCFGHPSSQQMLNHLSWLHLMWTSGSTSYGGGSSRSFGHYPKLMTIDEGWNVDRLPSGSVSSASSS